MSTTPDPEKRLRIEAAASPRRFVEVTGRRMALLGRENGVFECWMWPLCLFDEFHLVFRAPGHAVGIPGSALVAQVAVEPHALELVYEHADFRVRQVCFASADERALTCVLHLESGGPVDVEARLSPAMRAQWPAGLGGAIAARDEETGTLLLTEELGRFAALVGSPTAAPVEVHADHGLTREPVSFALRLEPGGEPAVLVVAGAQVEPEPLSDAARLGEADAARGFSRADRAISAARALWNDTVRGWPAALRGLRAHWAERLARDPVGGEFHDACCWAHAAIERAWVEVEGVGKGLLAGLAPSDGTSRPGFGWIFDGDAMTAARALTALGDFESVREILRLAAGRQREDGKLMHELVLSAGLCRWTEDYPYAFYKAGNTPALVAVLDHYVETSGDLELAWELSEHVSEAIEWCARCCDEHGLLANSKAGIAAVEAGPLVGRIHAEAYLNGIWISALIGGQRLALALDKAPLAERCGALLDKARAGFERLWSEAHGRYGFALLRDGALCEDLAAYTAHPMSRGIGTPERIRRTVAQLNHPALVADWGARMFSTRSSVYDPQSYNTGAVFPYLTNFECLALYEHGDPMAARQVLDGLLALHGFSGLGFVPEHLRGDVAVAPARGVPHQIFSSAAVIQSVVYGAWGLRCERGSSVQLRPTMHAHDLSVGRAILIAVGEAQLGCSWGFLAGQPTRFNVVARSEATSKHPLSLEMQPRFPTGSIVRRIHATRDEGKQATEPRVTLRPGEAWEATWEVELGPWARFGAAGVTEGFSSRDVRVLDSRFDGKSVVWTLAGVAGSTHDVPFRRGRTRAIHGAREIRDSGPPETLLHIEIPPGSDFVEHEITFELE